MLHKSPRLVKPESSGPPTARSTTQSRIRQRLSNSPLKLPLQNAIHKAMVNGDKFTNSRILVKSRLKEERDHSSSRLVSRNIYKDQPEYLRDKIHLETSNFLTKYFYTSVEIVPVESFIECIMREYQHLWGTQNSAKVFEDFNYKILQLFGENVSIIELIKKTMNDGMIGLILQIFKQIKSQQKIRASNFLTVTQNPRIQTLRRSFEDQLVNEENLDNVKNVVQQFMQTMYQCMETEIYNKFNVEMRRMVVKYRQAQRLIKKINEKIVSHADVFDFDLQLRNQRKQHLHNMDLLKREKEDLERQLFRQKNHVETEKRQNKKLELQIVKLKQNLEKFQNAVLSKVMEPPSVFYEPLMERKVVSNEMNGENKQNKMEPFKITIDTHTIQKDGEPPETKTVATLYNVGSLANINPSDGPSIAESRYDTPYSPYQSSYSRSRSPISMINRHL